jgi:phosphatidylserine/phosphatidylglycerophosphate/cardiolipin synthase-like enzyme
LLHVGGQWWSAVGSLNGSEGSYKLNREAVLLVESAGLYGWLGAVFAHDWERGH